MPAQKSFREHTEQEYGFGLSKRRKSVIYPLARGGGCKIKVPRLNCRVGVPAITYEDLQARLLIVSAGH